MSAGKGKQRAEQQGSNSDGPEEDLPSDSWDQNGKPRKFWIPSSDCNIVMGGNADPIIATASTGAALNQTSRLSATIQPEDVQWASDFAANTSDTRPSGPLHGAGSSVGSTASEIRPVAYTHFPPFRFAVEFPNPRVLKEKKRVYSQTVFYLGSFWNVYVQKVRRGKNPQLGVYLHRAKEREAAEVVTGGGNVAPGNSVDERIGQLEREMLIRADRRIDARRRMVARSRAGEAEVEADGGESSGSGDVDTGLGGGGGEASTGTGRASLGRKTSQTPDEPTGDTTAPGLTTDGGLAEEYEDLEDPELARLTRAQHAPTLPPYVDGRPTIRTYFKIYSPSKGGRMLSVYESAPDTFNTSQSWGWRSSTLMLDDGIALDSDEVGDDMGRMKKDGKLRFMIVIGNV